MRSHWSDLIASKLEGLEALVYASRLIGLDPALVLWGGGNSSVKVVRRDHLDRETRALWIKGSGSDMKTITAGQFTPLRLDELLPLLARDDMTDEEMVAYQARCVMEPGAPKPSIETLLHAFIPAACIFHTHADVVCTLTDTSDSAKFVRQVYGDDVALVPYVRPGFKLAKLVSQAYQRNPDLLGLILDKHGLVTWGDTAKTAYLNTIELVSVAERFIRSQIVPSPSPLPSRGRVMGTGSASEGGQSREGQSHGPLHRKEQWAPRACPHFNARAAILAPILRGAVRPLKRRSWPMVVLIFWSPMQALPAADLLRVSLLMIGVSPWRSTPPGTFWFVERR